MDERIYVLGNLYVEAPPGKFRFGLKGSSEVFEFNSDYMKLIIDYNKFRDYSNLGNYLIDPDGRFNISINHPVKGEYWLGGPVTLDEIKAFPVMLEGVLRKLEKPDGVHEVIKPESKETIFDEIKKLKECVAPNDKNRKKKFKLIEKALPGTNIIFRAFEGDFGVGGEGSDKFYAFDKSDLEKMINRLINPDFSANNYYIHPEPRKIPICISLYEDEHYIGFVDDNGWIWEPVKISLKNIKKWSGFLKGLIKVSKKKCLSGSPSNMIQQLKKDLEIK